MLRLQFKIRYGTNGPNHFIPLLHFHSFVEEGERYPSDWEPLAKLGWSNLNFAPISWHTFLNCSPAPHTSNKRKKASKLFIRIDICRPVWFPPKRWNVEKKVFPFEEKRGKSNKSCELKERSRLWVWPRSHQTNVWKIEKSNSQQNYTNVWKIKKSSSEESTHSCSTYIALISGFWNV